MRIRVMIARVSRKSCGHVCRSVMYGVASRDRFHKDVSGAATCMNEWPPRFAVNLATQSVDIHFDGVGEWVVIVIPHMRDDIGTRHYLSGMPSKEFEE